MAIKYQLQYALFNGSYYFVDKNGTQAKVTGNKDHIKNFTIILENLETLTSILQDIQVLNKCIQTSIICLHGGTLLLHDILITICIHSYSYVRKLTYLFHKFYMIKGIENFRMSYYYNIYMY